MFTESVEVEIERPIDEVFVYVTDVRNRPLWDESVESEELTSPEPVRVGSTIRTHLHLAGGSYVYEWEVTEHAPPRRMVMESTSGPFRTMLAFGFAGDERATTVRCEITGKPGGLLRLAAGKIARSTKGHLEKASVRLKELLEQ